MAVRRDLIRLAHADQAARGRLDTGGSLAGEHIADLRVIQEQDIAVDVPAVILFLQNIPVDPVGRLFAAQARADLFRRAALRLKGAGLGVPDGHAHVFVQSGQDPLVRGELLFPVHQHRKVADGSVTHRGLGAVHRRAQQGRRIAGSGTAGNVPGRIRRGGVQAQEEADPLIPVRGRTVGIRRLTLAPVRSLRAAFSGFFAGRLFLSVGIRILLRIFAVFPGLRVLAAVLVRTAFVVAAATPVKAALVITMAAPIEAALVVTVAAPVRAVAVIAGPAPCGVPVIAVAAPVPGTAPGVSSRLDRAGGHQRGQGKCNQLFHGHRSPSV